MSSDELLVEIVGSLVGAVVIAAFAAMLDRARRKPSRAEANVLRVPKIHFVIGIVYCILLFGFALVLLCVGGIPLLLPLLLALMGLPGVWIMASSHRTRFEVYPNGLYIQTLFRRRTWVSWEDVTSVRWAEFRQTFVVTTRTIGRFGIDAGLRGLPGFARQLLASVPHDRIDAKSLPRVMAVAKGVLPEIRTG